MPVDDQGLLYLTISNEPHDIPELVLQFMQRAVRNGIYQQELTDTKLSSRFVEPISKEEFKALNAYWLRKGFYKEPLSPNINYYISVPNPHFRASIEVVYYDGSQHVKLSK